MGELMPTAPAASVGPIREPLAGARSAARPILIADEDGKARASIDACLEALGLVNPRWFACNGDDAVEQLGRCVDGAPIPALVLLDAQMSGRPGLEVLRWIRAHPVLEAVPVILLDVTADVRAICHAYDSGVARYLVKPVAFAALGDVVRDLQMPWALV
jgi:CheY-like chemotaxis protein